MNIISFIWQSAVLSLAVPLLQGYLAEGGTLSDIECSALHTAVACRLCTSLVMGAVSTKAHPENAYLSVHAGTGAWDSLAEWWTMDKEAWEAVMTRLRESE